MVCFLGRTSNAGCLPTRRASEGTTLSRRSRSLMLRVCNLALAFGQKWKSTTSKLAHQVSLAVDDGMYPRILMIPSRLEIKRQATQTQAANPAAQALARPWSYDQSSPTPSTSRPWRKRRRRPSSHALRTGQLPLTIPGSTIESSRLDCQWPATYQWVKKPRS